MEEVLKELKESLKDLPSHIREVVTHAPWQDRIEELALKYSLTEEQKTALFTEVLLVLTAIAPEEELAESIESELQVSGILAEQLTEEIGERIFSWIQRLYTEKENVTTKSTSLENALDIPPVNLPSEVMEEEFGVVKSVPLQDQVNDFFAPAQMMEQAPEPPVKPEPVYIPQVPEMSTVSQPQSFIANKLTQPTVFAQQEEKPPVKYTADPYREPIE